MKHLLLCLLMAVLLTGCACADALYLPQDTVSVGDEAFLETDVTAVYLPDGLLLENIGERAFPEGVHLYGAQEDLKSWAEEHGYVVCGNRYALCIGQTYEGYTGFEGYELPSCRKDVIGMSTLFTANKRLPWQVTTQYNLTYSGICTAIRTVFADARDGDVCLFYYSGHGATDTGDLCPVDMYSSNKSLPISELRQLLDGVKGTKVIILDSCYSGALITELGGAIKGLSVRDGKVDTDAANSHIISVFSSGVKARSGAPEYVVITAASDAESAWSNDFGGQLTIALCYGAGVNMYSGDYSVMSNLAADINGDCILTHKENYAFGRSKVTRSSVQAYPAGGCDFPLWGR